METTSDFHQLLDEFNEEARSSGPEYVALLNAFDVHYYVASALLAARRAKGLNQRELSAVSGVPQADISRLERGRGNPTLATIEKLLGALDLKLTFGPILAESNA